LENGIAIHIRSDGRPTPLEDGIGFQSFTSLVDDVRKASSQELKKSQFAQATDWLAHLSALLDPECRACCPDIHEAASSFPGTSFRITDW